LSMHTRHMLPLFLRQRLFLDLCLEPCSHWQAMPCMIRWVSRGERLFWALLQCYSLHSLYYSGLLVKRSDAAVPPMSDDDRRSCVQSGVELVSSCAIVNSCSGMQRDTLLEKKALNYQCHILRMQAGWTRWSVYVVKIIAPCNKRAFDEKPPCMRRYISKRRLISYCSLAFAHSCSATLLAVTHLCHEH
jgi:hypothetical protein